MISAKLPKDDVVLANMIANQVSISETNSSVKKTMWLLAWYYLQGFRNFRVVNTATGVVLANYDVGEGTISSYRSSDLLFLITQVAGRIQGMDTSPVVKAQGNALGVVRSRATASAILSAILNPQELAKVNDVASWIFTCLGSVGIHTVVEQHPTMSLICTQEVVHPLELHPWPALDEDLTKQRGLIRNHWVPYLKLVEMFGRKVASNLEEMDYVEREEAPSARNSSNTSAGTLSGSLPTEIGALTDKDREKLRYVRISQLWTDGPGGTVSEYVVSSGDFIIFRQDYSDREVYCPLTHARFFNDGTFHGSGMFNLMFSLHRKLEAMAAQLFKNVEATEGHGILVLPMGQWDNKVVLRDLGNGLRALPWAPDPGQEQVRPFHIAPATTGEGPGRIASMAREMLKELSPVRDLIDEKGRVDSAAGLAALSESMAQSMTTPTAGVIRLFSSSYRTAVQQATALLAQGEFSIAIQTLTLDLAGALIDPQDQTVRFPRNPLPRMGHLQFGIKSTSPRSEQVRKNEMLALFERGIETDPLKFKLYAIKENLDFPLLIDAERSAMESATLACLLLFGDGVENNQVVLTPITTEPIVWLYVVDSFTNQTIFQGADPKIVDDFMELRQFLLTNMGAVIPPGAPSLEGIEPQTSTQ
jgi:hypothetical protein